MSLLNKSHKELTEAAKKGELVIFAGAGISKNVGLPLWKDLMLMIIEYITTNQKGHGEILRKMLKNDASDRKIFDCLNYIENHRLQRFVNYVLIEEIFNKTRELIQKNTQFRLHSKLWQLSTKIITPNYDILFESCDEFKALNQPVISNKSILSLSQISKYSHYLLKIHGNIAEIDDIIFYESQYKNQYEQNPKAITEKFKELVANNPILFVGTSLTDPYINQILGQVNSIFSYSSAKNFILGNDKFESADIIKIHGDPVEDLDSLLNELLSLKKEQTQYKTDEIPTLPKRIKTIKSAINDLHESNILFPSLNDFENDAIQLNDVIFNYVKDRFDHLNGPVLCEGRWSTGKSVINLRVGLELDKHGYITYYLDFADDIAGQEENIIKDYLHKILEKFRDNKTVFIVDNVHLFPEHTYKISRWAIKEKCNCIFVGRPLSQQFNERLFYYPLFFEHQESLYPKESHSEDLNYPDDILEVETCSSKITLAPSVEYIKSMFENKISTIGRTDILEIDKIQTLAESTSYNLSFIAFHIRNITTKSINIYEINYGLLYDFINDKFHLSEFTDELCTIAALSFLDCKCDSRAIFSRDLGRKNHFKEKQEHLIERREYIHGMHSATGKLILDLAVNEGLIRFNDNRICYDFVSALKCLLERYLANRPLNIYELFFGLSNYVYEAEKSNDIQVREEISELIHYLITSSQFASHYADIIIHKTDSLLKFGFFAKTFLRHKADVTSLHGVINEETLTKMVAAFIEFTKQRHGGRFSVNWHLKFAWIILRKTDKNLADFFLTQFPTESIIDYASTTIPALSSILEMAIYHKSIDELLFLNIDKVIKDEEGFKRKLIACREIKFFFFMRNVHKLSLGDFKNKKLLDKVKSYISPEDYRNYVKSLSKITLLSFITARRVFGKNYSETLQATFDKDFLYRLCYDKPLFKINTIISESGWKKFLKNELQNKLVQTSVDQIATFLRNICLHGISENFANYLVDKLYEYGMIQQLIDKLLNSDSESIFSFFWQLKTLDEHLFNIYFDEYCSKTEIEFEPLKIEKIKTAFLFLFLIYGYSYNLNSKSLLKQSDINSHLKKIVISNTFADKISLSALAGVFNLSFPIPYNIILERSKAIRYTDQMFHVLDVERNRFDVYNYLLLWWEAKILLFTAYLIGINKIDESIVKDKVLEQKIRSYRYDLKLILGNIEQRVLYFSKKSDEALLLTNRILILKTGIQILS